MDDRLGEAVEAAAGEQEIGAIVGVRERSEGRQFFAGGGKRRAKEKERLLETVAVGG